MSIVIDRGKCSSCGQCQKVCPGSLLGEDKEHKTIILYPDDCWGCAACVKSCSSEAIALFLSPATGGRGTLLKAKLTNSAIVWTAIFPDGQTRTISADHQKANQY